MALAGIARSMQPSIDRLKAQLPALLPPSPLLPLLPLSCLCKYLHEQRINYAQSTWPSCGLSSLSPAPFPSSCSLFCLVFIIDTRHNNSPSPTLPLPLPLLKIAARPHVRCQSARCIPAACVALLRKSGKTFCMRSQQSIREQCRV